MGRLSALSVVVVALAPLVGGCDEKPAAPPPPPAGRDNAVIASGEPTAAKPPSTAGEAGGDSAKAPKPTAICKTQVDYELAETALPSFASDGADKLDGDLPVGVGKWVWLNFWAAWCKPCAEEMPRLKRWEKSLRDAGVLVDVVFISIDDDERQLQRFIDKQPGEGVKASYWLKDGEDREAFFESLGYDDTPGLPLHALVAPSGKVKCLIEGAVEDTDYDAVKGFLAAK